MSEHRCGLDCSSVHVSDIVEITAVIDSDLFGRGTVTREVCPCCVDHPQGEVNEVYDCKNVFWEGLVPADRHDAIPDRMVRRSVGQCMCYSVVHGKREKAEYDDDR